MDLTPAKIQDLVTKAFCLEALADKDGCTSRYIDLPSKSLEDFIIAGINAAPFFARLAEDRLKGSTEVYTYLVESLKASNTHKSKKFINMGLLEIMCNVVAARLQCPDPDKVIMEITKVLKKTSKSDVKALIQVRKLGWSTSTNPQKKIILTMPSLVNASSKYEYNRLLTELRDKSSASWQWGNQAMQNWPILQELFTNLRQSKSKSILDNISDAFNPIRKQNTEIRIGILADMCAAAIFLYLSYL